MDRAVHKIVVVILLAAGKIKDLQNLLRLQYLALLVPVLWKSRLDKRVCTDVIPLDCQIKSAAYNFVNVVYC